MIDEKFWYKSTIEEKIYFSFFEDDLNSKLLFVTNLGLSKQSIEKIIYIEKIKQKITEPDLYKVIFLNDQATPMEFVIDVLIQIFKHSDTTARDLTVKIHEEGSAVVGVYTYEIAEQKGVEATNLSRTHGFPLQIKVEKQ